MSGSRSRLSFAELPSDALGRPLRYRLLEPAEDTAPAIAKLLLLHGSGGDERSWDPGLEALQEAMDRGALPPLAAVAPGSGTSWWVDGPEAVESAVIDELLPHFQADAGGPSPIFVAGFSMGGFGAVRYALHHHDLFAGAIAMSSALYDELPPAGSSARSSGAFGDPFDERRWQELNYPALLDSYRSSGNRLPFFIAVGDDDWNEPAGWQYNSEYQSLLLFERLHKEEGGSPARLRIDAGGHDWNFWRPMFLEGVRYLLGTVEGLRGAGETARLRRVRPVDF